MKLDGLDLDGFDRAVVLGLGRFGGGLGVTRALAEGGLPVLVVDREDEESLAEPIAGLAGLTGAGMVEVRAGSDRLPACGARDLLVVNPAVPRPWAHEGIALAEAHGARVTTEIELTVRALAARLGGGADLVAVTGSSGKSTTTAMIGAGLVAAGRRVCIGGNLGGSLLGSVATMPLDAAVVLEVSSAMLWWLGRCEVFAPRVGVLTTYAANHIDWHGDEGHYRRCKERLLLCARQTVVLGVGVADWTTRPGVRRVVAHGDGVGALRVPGAHNRLNAGIALAACVALGADAGVAFTGIAGFGGLEHRLRRIGAASGVVFFDDSKSTTPEATVLAVGALRESGFERIHLIAGGYDKGLDLSAISGLEGLASLATIGVTGEALAGSGGFCCGTLERAMGYLRGRVGSGGSTRGSPEGRRLETDATGNSATGEAVLLSPGCASWDQFENFTERGRRFAELVAEVFGCATE